MKRSILLVALLMLAPVTQAESVYTWTDKNGVVHFSDQPTLGASQVKIKEAALPEGSGDANSGVSGSPMQSTMMPNAPATTPSAHQYTVVSVTQPLDGQTFPNSDGTVTVQVSMDPQLQDGDKIQLIMDGQPMGGPQTSTALSLANVERGTHHISARVVDAAGNTLTESSIIVFYMQRPLIRPNVKK